MRTQRGGTASARHVVAGLALCLGALTACNASAEPSADEPADPPTTDTREGPITGEKPASGDGMFALDGKVIVIDPGHNGGNAEHPSEINKQVKIGNGSKACDTTGTSTADGYNEHAFTWDVSNRLAKILRARGAKVTLTRKNDKGVGPCIDERADVGNRLKADAAVSIHADGAAASGHGFHIIQPVAVGKNAGMVPRAARLGRALRDAYRDGTGIAYSTYLGEDGIDKRKDLGGLNLSTVPKVFIECGNMRNKGDAAKLSSASFRQRIAESLAKGFASYLT
ncbi:N-acetylmuramoyl-L-alanine amidase [Actinomadura pelletieri DSM 43383]|uniref:N-acetylmuramoyl-L-alanine amidase n=1 Tax=Actinomadura pelletieri DSM 43383 TaxID=1120940 RepID=A0A495QZX6_9ACTN|nr:N-acetylmuramoyl-L-alanine amidase [Actinomadura pelletieri]RKS79779.1 N-acetylmuramoyl-L-alanine amidase [Actinomadura pelletieri DSM 43383]